MNDTIYKYPLAQKDRQIIDMPSGAECLSVHLQNGDVCLWALVNKAQASTDRVVIRIVGTGNPFDRNGLTFIGTVIQGPFVWHVFREVQP